MINKNKSIEVSQDEMRKFCQQLKIKISDDNLLQLKIYLELLIKWNKVINLVGIRKWREIFKQLMMDSFYLCNYIKDEQQNSHICADPCIFDLGAGAGIPGIPLRIVWQEGHYYMIETREKRGTFLSIALDKLELPQTYIFKGRAEDFSADKGILADIIVSRAFMPWQKLLPLVENMLNPQGKVIFFASEPAPEKLINNWQIVSEKLYIIQNKERFFWLVENNA